VQFSELVGERILLVAPKLLGETTIQEVKLIGVEAGGLWIESQFITNSLLQSIGKAASPKTMVVFVPYQEITFAMTSIDGPSLDEKAFGL
jgi:hypothetical protein